MTAEAKHSSATGWLILALCTLTTIFVYAIPTLALPVLFGEIAAELNLDVFQLGVAWGAISLSAMLVGLFGGAIGDRFGSKRTLGVVCLLIGILGALRGFSSSYIMLVGTFMLYGLVAPSLPPNLHKTGAYFFPQRRGIATGTISLGFAFALFLGVRYTATWLSPLAGGWRNVLFLFGIFGVLIGTIWLGLVPDKILPQPSTTDRPFWGAIFDSLRHVVKVRELWIIGLAAMLFWACYRGFTGYTPIYLRGLGWDAAAADQALSNFFLSSLILAMPLIFLAEWSGKRRPFLMLAVLTMGSGIILLGSGSQARIGIGLIIGGVMFDAFMALHQAEVLDLKGIGVYAGSALGVLVMFREAGGFLSPPIGNWLAQFGANIPFYFWGGLAVLAAILFLFLPSKSTTK